MLPTVLCLARSRQQVEQIIERLNGVGVPTEDISVLMVPTEADGRPEPIKGLSFGQGLPGEKTSAAAATGGVAGAAAGTAVMSVVGLTPLLMIAPLVVATGAALGAGAGALASGLSDFGIPAARMDHYQQRLLAGDFLVAVRSEKEKELEQASAVFTGLGVQDSELFRLTKKLDQ